MFNKRKYISVTVGIIFILTLFDFATIYATPTVTADITAMSRHITVTGQIQNATEENQVTLLVGDIDNIIFIAQTTSNSAGSFIFNFVLPENFPTGNYNYNIGSDSGATVYRGTFTYRGATQTRKFIDAAVNISLENYVPKIVGTVHCGTGKSITLNITNTTDNSIIANDVINAEDGVCEISYTLPSLISAKDYTVSIVCSNAEKALASMELAVNSSVILVSASGTITTADRVTANAQLKSTSTDLINKSTIISGTKSVSGTLPNVLANATYDFFVEGFEEYYPTDDVPSCTIMSGASNEVKVSASARNLTTFDGRTFEINYDTTQLEAVNLWGLVIEDETGTGRKGNVDIIAYAPGKIIFKIVDKQIPDGKVWSGVLNTFEFRMVDGHSSNATITIN